MQLEIPPRFFEVEYNGAHFPRASHCGLKGGANCQVFVYEILNYFAIELPAFRSSELWEDETYTKYVEDLKPLDILLWNKTKTAWGAHLGLYVGEGKAIHLSKQIGKPVIWPLEEFEKHERYAIFLGAKRGV